MQKSYDNRVLVAGGAGFIGSHLCERLLKIGYKVICVDNFITSDPRNTEHLIANKMFERITHDIADPLDIDVSLIINLASPASPTHYQLDRIRTIKTNVYGSMNLLELAKRSQARILQASTSEVYGDPTINPQTEEYWGNVNPIGLRSCYDEGKRCAEALFFDYHRQHGVKIKVVRIFNTYGPRMLPQDGRVISNFIWQAINNKDITIYGDGSQTRSFCFVDDLINGLLQMIESPSNIIGPINIGNPNEITIVNLAKTVIDMTNSESKIITLPLPCDDPTRRCPDITKAINLLGWRPSVTLRDGLQKTISYFMEYFK